ncbi:hypothetical protein [Roseivirga seohaensis]|uniref:hypothetical protein n=1 Tax=Roseivirga seohaensis TaxID=1914963 RepID=UPI003BADAC83
MKKKAIIIFSALIMAFLSNYKAYSQSSDTSTTYCVGSGAACKVKKIVWINLEKDKDGDTITIKF